GLDGTAIRRPDDVRFVLSRKRIGDPVEIRFGPDGGPASVRDTIVPFYSQAPFPLPFALLGGFSFLAGFGVLLLKPADRRGRIFYWLCISFGAAVTIGWATAGVQGRTLNLLPGTVVNFAYPLTLAVLLWFARSYAPHRRMARPSLFWVVPLAWGAFLAGTFLVSQLGPSIAAFRLRQQGLNVFRLYIVVMGVLALVEFARAFRSSRSAEDRAEIKWYFIGLAVGLGPFLALNQLPQALSLRPPLSDDFVSAFFFLLPIFMATVILQFRLLRVNVVFHRGLVYAILTAFTICAYLFSVDALRLIFPRATATGRSLIYIGTAVALALFLSPGRRAIRDFVDRLFFRQAYDYRRAVQTFKERAPAVIEAEGLLSLFSRTLMSVLPVEGIGVLLREGGRGEGRRWSQGIDEAAAARLAALPTGADRLWVRAQRVRGVAGGDPTRETDLEAAGAAVALALPRGAGTPQGLLAFGPKRSGHRFTNEDIDLLQTLSGDLAVNLGRIRIQEEMIYERASREKSEELVRMKTEFISALSHELRTPMTSLTGLSELLRSGKVEDPAQRERLLGLMAGECGRLARFLTNVLDYGRIEAEARSYAFRDVDLGPLTRDVADLVRGSLEAEGPAIEVEAPGAPVVVRADPDAVRQALLNLLDNAVKYSPKGGPISVALTGDPEAAVIAVRDRGIGIAPSERDRIFEAFYRSPQAVERFPTGVGLGLRIVRHIMDAHGGRVDVASEPGRGSVFSLVFPRSNEGSG
ncbi:MAG TPA: ATP-binding protein, partial [Acidobacteriota bacterium]|nr:ATP-binding protein [Acidobacteriota bacterium]